FRGLFLCYSFTLLNSFSTYIYIIFIHQTKTLSYSHTIPANSKLFPV
ncbi:hypothetical protein LINPERHAP1_LOCUS4588, partial [Linum perenne]